MEQRVIKFRGKIINGDWVCGNLSILTKPFGKVEAGYYISNSAGSPFAFQVRPETVGQYVGVKDKNLVDIYEGDKVEGYWAWMSGDGYLKKGFPDKIRKWFEVRYQNRHGNAGFELHELQVHPDDQFAADEYFYRSIQCHLSEDREFQLKDNKVQWKGKCESLEVIGTIHDK